MTRRILGSALALVLAWTAVAADLVPAGAHLAWL